MKKPKFLIQLSATIAARKKRLNATARTAPRAAMSDYDAEEPTTKLSSAFIVVFILHVVAIGGIYAFNGIKASRVGSAPAPAVSKDAPKTAATSEAKAPALVASAAKTAGAHPADTGANATPATVPTVKAPAQKQHQVVAGDNPTKIAFAYSIKPDELLAANNLKEGAVLHQGQVLTIPTPKLTAKPVVAEVPAKQTDVPPTKTTPGLYHVKKGDTAFSIAKTYGLKPEEILTYNKITDAKKIQLNQALKIPPKKG